MHFPTKSEHVIVLDSIAILTLKEKLMSKNMQHNKFNLKTQFFFAGNIGRDYSLTNIHDHASNSCLTTVLFQEEWLI